MLVSCQWKHHSCRGALGWDQNHRSKMESCCEWAHIFSNHKASAYARLAEQRYEKVSPHGYFHKLLISTPIRVHITIHAWSTMDRSNQQLGNEVANPRILCVVIVFCSSCASSHRPHRVIKQQFCFFVAGLQHVDQRHLVPNSFVFIR
jgi:hypothetical protein